MLSPELTSSGGGSSTWGLLVTAQLQCVAWLANATTQTLPDYTRPLSGPRMPRSGNAIVDILAIGGPPVTSSGEDSGTEGNGDSPGVTQQFISRASTYGKGPLLRCGRQQIRFLFIL